MALAIDSAVTLHNGVAMPLFGLGTWQIPDGAPVRAAVAEALRVGYRLIDTAAAYGNEAGVGAAVRESGLDRRQVFVTSKVWTQGLGRGQTPVAFADSLARLDLGPLDLYLIHWPADDWQDAWRAMLGFLEDGRCRAIGVSNFEIAELEAVRAISPVMPAVNQVPFSPYQYRRDLLDYCAEYRIRLEGYSPLTRGQRLHDPRLVALARRYGKTSAQLLIRWALQHGVVTIPKAAHAAHIRENADVFDFAIADDDLAAMDGFGEA